MPFSKTTDLHTAEYWTNHFNTYLKPLIEENTDLEAFRSEALRGDILRQIITDLVTSPVVVADLTDANPNVYWELGIRQSFKHGTITVAEEGTKRQFDLSIKGILHYYPHDHIKDSEFRRVFKKAISDCLEHPEKPDSHVLETLTGRGTIYQIIQQDESVRRMQALLSECDFNLDLLRDINRDVEKNQKEPDKRAFTPYRLASSAAELLLTHRYLDEDSSFYRKISNCFASISALNDQLREWITDPELFETWFLEAKDVLSKSFEEHRKALENAQRKLLEKQY